jgi:hypothetical protein
MKLDPVQGKIIKILDNERIIVNVGYNDGVVKGMKFYIFSEGDEVNDPETNISLGRIEIIKHRVIVIQVQDKFSIMRSNEFFSPPVERFFIGSTASRKMRTFNIEETCKDAISLNKCIHVGDKVKQEIIFSNN